MNIRIKLTLCYLAILFAIVLAPHTMRAQNNGEAATDTTVTPDDTATVGNNSERYGANSAAAERAYAQLSGRLPRPAVPHLDPILVRNAMSNPAYIGNFTFVIGHRGYHSAPGCPENSACGLAAAYDVGSDGTEFDVKLSAPDASDNVGITFGHDYTIGREQSNWSTKNISGNWNFTANFPNPDPAYTKGTITSPFGINFSGNNDKGQNDKRATLTELQQVGDQTYNGLGNWTLRDQYGTALSNQYELNLYQFLYLAQKYFPLMPWLDVKNKNDLIQTGKVIQQAQADFVSNGLGAGGGTSGPVHAVAFKLGPAVLLGTAAKKFSDRVTSVRTLLGIPDVSYFFVFGTGDLDNLVAFGQALPQCDNGCPTLYAAELAFFTICSVKDGCLGGELNHKYLDAPTQTFFDYISSSASIGWQLASFQTIGQFEWYWQGLSPTTQFENYGAYGGRTDGSCCFSLLQPQLLNSSTNFGTETGDSRADYGWNEQNFTTITTDEPANVLKDLWTLKKRPVSLVTNLAASGSTETESGGSDVGPFRDGLYALVNQSSGQAITVSGSSTGVGALLVQEPVTYAQSQLWYLAYLGNEVYTVTSANSNMSIQGLASGGNPSQEPTNGAALQQWRFQSYVDGTYIITQGNDTLALDTLPGSQSGGAVVEDTYTTLPGATQHFFVEPLVAPSDTLVAGVSANLPGAPRHLHYFTTPNSISVDWAPPAYTVNNATITYTATLIPTDSFVAAPEPVQTGGTTASWAGLQAYEQFQLSVRASTSAGTGPAASKLISAGSAGSARCNYNQPGPLYPDCDEESNTTYTLCASEGGTCNFTGDRNVAYGANGIYRTVTATNTIACSINTPGFSPDPIYGVVKSCYVSPPIGYVADNGTGYNAGSVYCADEGETCSYEGNAYPIMAGGDKFDETFFSISNSFLCDWKATFYQDPAPGIRKACFYQALQGYVIKHYGPSGYQFCAGENGVCEFKGLGRIAYGATSFFGSQMFHYGVFNGGVACNNSVFGDPAPTYTKDCYYQVVTAVGTAGGAGNNPPGGGSGNNPPGGGSGNGGLTCDLYASGGTPCVAAHSTVRALFSGYSGRLYQVKRALDNTTIDVGTLSAGGYANAAAQDSFCANTSCTITTIYDQTSQHNDLAIEGGGGAAPNPDSGAVANALPITLNGNIKVYGVKVTPGVGYRNNATRGVATGSSPEGMYMVTSGTYVNSGCCFDYGNVETNSQDNGEGHMDALNFGTYCEFTCNGSGPWVEADLENGQYMGNGTNLGDVSMGFDFVTAMLKNDGKTTFALKGGNAQSGGLTTDYAGSLPTTKPGYIPMKLEGAIVLGTGGDNSNSSLGSFFEGAMTSGYPTDATEDAVQASIVSAGYSGNSGGLTTGPNGTTVPPGPYTGPSDPGGPGPQDGFASPATEQPNDVMATKPSFASFNGSLFLAFEGVGVNNDLYVTSSPTGNNFPTAPRYTNLVSSSAPALATFNNQLFMAFRGLNVGNALFVTSSPTGSNFPTATGYTNIQMGGAPALAVFNNQLFAAFQSNDPRHLLFITSSSDGKTWPTAWGIPNVQIGSDPAMAVFNGMLYVAFRANDASNVVWIASSPDGINFTSQPLLGQTMAGTSSPALVVSNNVLYYIYGANDSDNEMLVTTSTDGTTWQGPAAYLGVQMGATGSGAAEFGNGITVGFQSNDSRNVLYVTNKVTEAASYTGPSDPGGPGPQDGFASPASEQPNDVMATKPAFASFNGSLYLAFEGVGVNNDLFVSSSSTGNNFPTATPYTNLQSSSPPALAAFNNKLFMAFRGLNAGNALFVTSSPTGSNFPTATGYGNIQMGGAPALAVFNNQLFAAFRSNDPRHLLFITSSSDGQSWSTAWGIPNVHIGSDPALAVFNGRLYVAFRADDPSNVVWIASSLDGVNFTSQPLLGQTMGYGSSPALAVSNNVLYYIYEANDAGHEMLVTASGDGSNWQGPAAYPVVQMGVTGPAAAAFSTGVVVGFQSNDARNVLFVTSKVTGTPAPPEQTQPPTTSNPQPGAFMNDAALLGNVNDPAWFLSNIPFFEAPDSQIQQVYYYRWQTYKEHLVYTSPLYGWLSTEFLTPASYGAPYGGINAAAGHQITEGRWLRDQEYVKNDINYWLNGPGQNRKPQDFDHNPDTSDWAHEYSYWAASSLWQTFLATGDQAFATSLLPQLVTQYRGWDNHFNSQLGLYWQYPVWDASEYSPASFESSDPYHGGAGYRPTINSYQFGDAQAIAAIANLAGNSALASEYTQRAGALQAATMKYLWDSTRKFFYHMNRDNNSSNALLDTREEEGFVPWMFELPTPAASSAMAQLLDPSGFAAAYGPPTAEKRSSWYMYQATSGCCHWDGPSWPYETSQTLTGVANLLIDYPAQGYVSANDYVNMLHTYAATQYKNGSPYVSEAHDPDNNDWIYDSVNHSEDYNHSTYIDNVISGLIGLRGQPGNTLLISPLAPPSWDYFALENTPYHGHTVSVLWDRLGTRYGQGQGLSVFVDNNRVLHQSTLNPVTINVGSTITQTGDGLFDVAVNSQQTSYGPQPIASYVFSPVDSIWNGIDGIVYRTGIPENSRWTTYLSPHSSDYYGVNFQRGVTIQEVRITFYDDGGGTRVPSSYQLQYLNSSNVWTNIVPTQSAPAPNTLTSIKFSPITTGQIRVLANDTSPSQAWGISELQAMSTSQGSAVSTGWYQIINYNSSKLMGVHNEYPFDSAQIQQYEDDRTPDHSWSVEDQGNGYFKIRNLMSNLVLGVDQESTADSAHVVQFHDNGTPDHLWKFISKNGVFQIQNMNSGLLLGVDTESTANSANVVQFHDNGTPDHLWIMSQIPDPNAKVTYKYMNYNSGAVLAVQDGSVADGAQIQQYADNEALPNYYLTPDHLWEKDDQGGGSYMLRNVLSNLVLGVDQESKADSALIKQAQNNGTPDHYWQFTPQFTIPNPLGSGTIQCSKIANYNSGLLLGVDGESTSNSANVVQFHDNGTPDHDWCEFPQYVDPRNKAVYKIVNVNSSKVLAVQNMSFADGAQIQQFSDSGTLDHIWQLEDAGGGYFKILNLRSNLVLGIDKESTADSALIKQAQDNGTPDHLWMFVNVGNDQFKIQNKLSGLLLGVDQMSVGDSANVVQFHDNGTADHLWMLQATGWPTLFP